MAAPRQAFDELLADARRRALHLEMRDAYAGSRNFVTWLSGGDQNRAAFDTAWAATLTPFVERNGDLRRARIISEPVSDYIRFEHEVTPVANIAAGERVRWLPRSRASDLALPGNDFWLFDDIVLFNLFSGDGMLVKSEVMTDPDVVKFCETAFEDVWSRGVDHADYRPA